MSKRINVMLPDETLAVLDRVAAKGARSNFISKAVLFYVTTQGKMTLRERLKMEALTNNVRDAQIAADWFLLDAETDSRIGHRKKSGTPG